MSARLQVLYLEDKPNDVMLVKRALDERFPDVVLKHAKSRDEYLEYLESEHFDVLLSDHSIPGCEDLKAFHAAHERRPGTPFIYLSGFHDRHRDLPGLRAIGVDDFVSKSELSRLAPAIERARAAREPTTAEERVLSAHGKLLNAIGQLSQACNLPLLMSIVCKASRILTGADGASFVLREGEVCMYADEEAIAPLWKGEKIAAQACISGWAMAHCQPAVVEDTRRDARTPAQTYARTFARSAVCVPVRSKDPIGAIEVCWSTTGLRESWEIRLLQSLADAAAVAMEHLRVHQEREALMLERKAELEAFSHAVSHDLRGPLRHVTAFSGMLLADHADGLDESMRYYVQRISAAAAHMTEMIEGLLQLSILTTTPVHRGHFDLAELALQLAAELDAATASHVRFAAPPVLPVFADPALLRLAMQHLLANAWKFSGRVAEPRVELGVTRAEGGQRAYYVRDNGVGFDEADASRLFGVFQRLHLQAEYPGAGLGLATVRRIVQKHDGRIWASSKPDAGATFYFTLGNGVPD
jgi:signal transduction histidine kinase